MKNIFFNWNKIVSNKVLLFSFFLFSSQINFAQCTISSFTVAPTNATCFSNGEIKVSIPTGQSGCTGNVRLIPVTGANNTPVPSQTQQLTVPSSGGEVVFSSLPAGKYNIETFDGFTTYNYASNPVTITSSYTPMTLNLSSTAPTCAAGTTGYVANGTFTATVVGGTGPFEYTLTSASGVQTFSSASRTQVFNTIQAGETVTIVVTDKVNNNPGCQVSVTQTHDGENHQEFIEAIFPTIIFTENLIVHMRRNAGSAGGFRAVRVVPRYPLFDNIRPFSQICIRSCLKL